MDPYTTDMLAYPPYYLVFGSEWPDPLAETAEAAYALAPACVAKKGLPKEVYGVLSVCEIYSRDHPDEPGLSAFSDGETVRLGHEVIAESVSSG
jgi:hypothetical protein